LAGDKPPSLFYPPSGEETLLPLKKGGREGFLAWLFSGGKTGNRNCGLLIAVWGLKKETPKSEIRNPKSAIQ
jgi:hypothetical protein